MIGEFGSESVGIGRVDEGVQPQVAMTLGIRHWCNASLGLKEDLGSIAEDDGEEKILIRLLEGGFKSKLVAIEGDGSNDVADDEAW